VSTDRTPCRWDRTAEAYLLRTHRPDCTGNSCDGCQPCTHDDAGNPVHHCPVRRRCTSHLGWTERASCPTCLGKIRSNLTAITEAVAVMPTEAEEQGVDSAAAEMAGPHADYVTASWRLINAHRNGEQVEELDLRDPYTCLTLHERTIREDLGHDGTTLVSPTLAATCGYLAWVLTDLARDETQANALASLLADTARLRGHLEALLRDAQTPERGAPCPECSDAGRVERLHRRYPHYCDDPECERLHFTVVMDGATGEPRPDTSADVWVCPANRRHWWTHDDYEKWVEERRTA
jgi:hypothetical protein